MTKFFMAGVFAALLVGSFCGSMAQADQTQSVTSVYGGSCDSGNVVCTSGRVITCNANANGNTDYYTYCFQQTGSVGYVQCTAYNSAGQAATQSTDACP